MKILPPSRADEIRSLIGWYYLPYTPAPDSELRRLSNEQGDYLRQAEALVRAARG